MELTTKMSPPDWALWERYLLDTMSAAAKEFVRRYTRPDGTLIWRENWPGMDGSDDAYESFFNFPLLAALGGESELDSIARREWEAITQQFRAYGQIYREFDAYYDWMHHGESSLLFYYFGLADPSDLRMRARAVRFAGMYLGEDAEAANYDPVLKLIRSPITGSRGPRFENSADDWVTHRPVLANYPCPFGGITGMTTEHRADWNDDAVFEEILARLNRCMMRGDVPLNLTATGLIANAFLYTGETKYRDWVRDYVTAWLERAQANGGVLPDNVGLSGQIGECLEGKWYGGYYGWRWPHGFMTLIEPAMIGAANALLLTGDEAFLELPRQLLDRVFEQGKEVEGVFSIPHRHGDRGWYDYRPLHTGVHSDVSPVADYPVYLWFLSRQAQDLERVAQWQGDSDWSRLRPGRGKGDNTHAANWFHYIQGRNPDYPEAILRVNYEEVCRRAEKMLQDDTDPETWDVHHWQEINPIVCEGLVQLMCGCPQTIYHGGLLHASLRYFDPDFRRPGLPPDVAALVHRVDAAGVEVELVNLHPAQTRHVQLQAGAFAEHSFTDTSSISPHLTVTLGPASGGRLRLNMQRYANPPTYRHPW